MNKNERKHIKFKDVDHETSAIIAFYSSIFVMFVWLIFLTEILFFNSETVSTMAGGYLFMFAMFAVPITLAFISPISIIFGIIGIWSSKKKIAIISICLNCAGYMVFFGSDLISKFIS